MFNKIKYEDEIKNKRCLSHNLCSRHRSSRIGKRVIWRPASLEQKAFMFTNFARGREDVDKIPEIVNKVSKDAGELNRFLAEQGFTIKLDPFVNPSDFGVVSILKLLLEWVKVAAIAQVGYGMKDYPAVKMEEMGVRFFKSEGHKNPIAVIPTKSGDEVCLSAADESYDGGDLTAHTDRVFGDLQPARDYSGLIFPMVDLNHDVDISWLKGMPAYSDNKFEGAISQALQQTKFAMDEKGAIVKSAVAIGAYRSCVPALVPTLVINQPFFAIVRRPGLSLPIFAGYIAEDCWKKPAR